MKLELLTLVSIRKHEPCYDPTLYLPENWEGTVVDILEVVACPAVDRLWVATHFLPDSINRRFASMVAQRALDETYPTAEDGYAAAMIAELRALGVDVSQEDIDAAESAARGAAESAARSAAWSVAESAARSAAWSAAWSVAESAARSAAWSAAESAAWSAAQSAARSAAQSDQVELLLWLIETD